MADARPVARSHDGTKLRSSRTLRRNRALSAGVVSEKVPDETGNKQHKRKRSPSLRDTARKMSHENVEIIRRANALANAGDWDALLELYHPDVETRDLQHAPDVPEVTRGLEPLRLVLEHWTDVYDEFGAEVYEYIDAHPWVICDARWYGKGKGSDVPIDIHVADTFEIRDGKIVRAIMSYPDVATAVEAVRQREQA
jgi:ketosteroid isomerase-like protein